MQMNGNFPLLPNAILRNDSSDFYKYSCKDSC